VSRARVEAARALYAEGRSIKEIAAQLRCPSRTVYYWRIRDRKASRPWKGLRAALGRGGQRLRRKGEIVLSFEVNRRERMALSADRRRRSALLYFAGFEVREIADILGLGFGTVRWYQKVARKAGRPWTRAEDLVLTYAEAGRYLGVSLRTVQRYVAAGRLAKVYTGRRLPGGQREKGVLGRGVQVLRAGKGKQNGQA